MLITASIEGTTVLLKIDGGDQRFTLEGDIRPIYSNNLKRGAIETVTDLLMTHESQLARIICAHIPENTHA